MSRIALLLALFLALGIKSYSQQSQVLHTPLSVYAKFNDKDSTLSVVYTSNLEFPQLLWVRDISVDAILSQDDVAGSYLASPIVHEIYLVDKKVIDKTSNSYFFRKDSTVLNLYNYKMLEKGEKLEVRIKVKDDKLYKLIIKRQFVVKGVVSLLDLTNLQVLVNRNPKLPRSAFQFMMDYPEDNKHDLVQVNDVKWNMGTYKSPVWGSLDTSSAKPDDRAERRLILPKISEGKTPKIFSLEELYSFASKFYFDVEIRISN